ncbi:MAG: hypothetical protein HYX40_05215 [Sphingobacteriales bacterium]|nr:hypothetical protein [Sphingobacteriales bacterium]
MKVAEQIRKKIKSIPESQPFGYADLGIAPGDFFTAAKALERLQKKGKIKKVSKGIFYKPEISIFGAMPPDYDVILKNYLYQNGKRVGYVTGSVLYNQLNLSTQMAFRTKIATNRKRKKIDISWLKTDSVKAYTTITDENYRLLEILDAIKDIKLISDTPVGKAVRILMPKIKLFAKKDIENLMQYALQYPPRVRALLGAIIENIFGNKYDIFQLKNSLNPSTIFKLGIKNTDLPTIQNWNIK